MTKMLAFGADSAAALARSRTIDAFVLKRSVATSIATKRGRQDGEEYRLVSFQVSVERPLVSARLRRP